MHLVTRGSNVSFSWKQTDRLCLSLPGPTHCLFLQIEIYVLGDVEDVRIFFIDRIPLAAHLHGFSKERYDFSERMIHSAHMQMTAEFLREIIARVNKCAASV